MVGCALFFCALSYMMLDVFHMYSISEVFCYFVFCRMNMHESLAIMTSYAGVSFFCSAKLVPSCFFCCFCFSSDDSVWFRSSSLSFKQFCDEVRFDTASFGPSGDL